MLKVTDASRDAASTFDGPVDAVVARADGGGMGQDGGLPAAKDPAKSHDLRDRAAKTHLSWTRSSDRSIESATSG